MRAVRHLKRYHQIISVLVRHGFADVIEETRLDQIIERGRELLGATPSDGTPQLSRPARVRKVMEELGPTFIKLGQILSTRSDLIPVEWANELSLLQHECARIPFEKIDVKIDEEFGDRREELFDSIDPEAMAAASMAQVHRAQLRDGTDVVLKVLRPEIHELIRTDIEVLRGLAEITEQYFKNLGISPSAVVDEFAREIRKELDLAHEGRVTDRFARAFRDDDGIRFPRIFWEASTREILTMEEIKGTMLSSLPVEELDDEQRRTIVTNGSRAVLRMCLELGVFHADPHPGNVFVMPDFAVCFIDCGMTGQTEPSTRHQLGQLVQGVVSGDFEQVYKAVIGLGNVDLEETDESIFRRDVQDMVDRFIDVPLEYLDMREVLDAFFEALRKHHLRCPANVVLLIKALTTMESVAARIDPSFDMISYGRPFVERLVRKRYRLSTLKGRMQRSLVEYVDLAEMLPSELNRILMRFRRNRFSVNLEHKGLSRLTHTIEHASRNVSYSLIIAALVVASSVLVMADRGPSVFGVTVLGLCGFIAALFVTLLLLLSNWREKSR